MACDLPRRTLLQLIAGAAAGISAPVTQAVAASNDSAIIGWPNDVPSWDPNHRTMCRSRDPNRAEEPTPEAQSQDMPTSKQVERF